MGTSSSIPLVLDSLTAKLNAARDTAASDGQSHSYWHLSASSGVVLSNQARRVDFHAETLEDLRSQDFERLDWYRPAREDARFSSCVHTRTETDEQALSNEDPQGDVHLGPPSEGVEIPAQEHIRVRP